MTGIRRLVALSFVFVTLMPVATFSQAQSTVVEDRGDLNGDGIVDGLDALLLMRTVEGYRTATAEDSARGDVHPFPGVNGRMIGDGLLTADDAARILRVSIGLEGEGLLTGAFDEPFISELLPAQGQAGTEVQVIGANFVAGSTVDNVVLFGEVRAEVRQATGTALTVVVPNGAVSSPVLVLGPGGIASSDLNFEILQTRDAVLKPPAGMAGLAFEVVNTLYDGADPDADGSFSIDVLPSGLTTHMALPEDDSERPLYLLDLVENGEAVAGKSLSEAAEMNVQSTAEAMVYYAPQFAATPRSESGSGARQVLGLIRKAEAVRDLADVLETLYDENIEPFWEDSRYTSALESAVEAVMDSVDARLVLDLQENDEPSSKAMTRSEPRQIQRTVYDPGDDLRPITVLYPDKAVTLAGEVRFDGSTASIFPESVPGNPIEWTLHMADIPDAISRFENGFASIRQEDGLDVWPRGSRQDMAFISSDSYVSEVDWFGNLFTEHAWEPAIEWGAETTGLTGVATQENALRLRRDTTAVYVVRAFSGNIVPLRQAYEDAVISKIPNGRTDATMTLVYNAMYAATELASGFIGSQVTSQADRLAGMFRGVMKATVPSSLDRGREAASPTNRLDAWRFYMRMVYTTAQEFVGNYASGIPGMIADNNSLAGANAQPVSRGVNTLLKASAKAIDVGFRASMIGKAVERFAAATMGIHHMEITPLETWVIVVGDPFNPRITGFSPERAGTGEPLEIYGERFGFSLDNLTVQFDEFAAEATEVSDSLIRLTIPYGIDTETEYSLIVKTRQGTTGSNSDIDKKLLVSRSPRLSKLEPTEGFAWSSSAFDGAGYHGTTIRVRGADLSQDADPADLVIFNGDHLLVDGAIERGSSYYDAWLPPPDQLSEAGEAVEEDLYSGTRLWTAVRKFEDEPEDDPYDSNRLNVIVLGAPVISSVEPSSVKAGESVFVAGKNFTADTNETRVRLLADGQTLEPSVTWRSLGRLEFVVPENIAEDATVTVRIETPEGTATGTFLREAGIGVAEALELGTGFRLTVTDTSAAGFSPGGALSLDEALAFASGAETRSPYASPWDDLNRRVYEVYDEVCSQTEDGNCVDWSEQFTRRDTTTSAGGSGHEQQVTYQVVNRHTGAVDTTQVGTTDLDDGSRPDQMPEEGDSISGTAGGKDLKDIIQVQSSSAVYRMGQDGVCDGDAIDLGGATVLAGAMLELRDGCEVSGGTFTNRGLTISGSNNTLTSVGFADITGSALVVDTPADSLIGSNTIRLAISGASEHGVHIKNSVLNRVEGTIDGTGLDGVRIEDGRQNETSATITNADRDGISIEGGSRNQVNGTISGSSDAGVAVRGSVSNEIQGSLSQNAVGLLFADGASFNKAHSLTSEQNETGIRITGDGTRGNAFDDNSLVRAQSNTGAGLELLDGALENALESLRITGNGEGVVISGAGTRSNVIGKHLFSISDRGVEDNIGTGVHIRDGASQNTVYGYISGNGRHGVLIDGPGTDGNRIDARKISNNAEAGIRIVGDGVSGPDGTVIESFGTEMIENGLAGIWISGVRPKTEEASVYLRTLDVSRSPVGIRIDEGSQGVRTGSLVDVESCETAVMLSGEETSFNSLNIDIDAVESIGFHVLDGASENSLGGTIGASSPDTLFDAGHVAILLEDAFSNEIGGSVRSVNGDAVVVSGGAANVIQTDVTAAAADGVVIEAGATGTQIIDNSIQGVVDDGIVIQGEATRGTFMNDLQVKAGRTAILVRDGASFTTFGREEGGGFASMRASEAITGVHITEGADSVFVASAQISGLETGLLIDAGANHVRVGTGAESSGGRLAAPVALAIRGPGTRDVRVLSTDVSSARTGMRVSDGATDIVIGEEAELQVDEDGQANAGPKANRVTFASEVGIHASGEDTAVRILGNQVWLGAEGIRLDGGIRDVEVRGNVITRNSDGPGVGMRVDGAHDILVEGNQFTRNAGSGILLDGGTTGTMIRDNLVWLNHADGVLVRDNAVQNTIRGNWIERNDLHGIRLETGGNLELSAPVIDGYSAETNRVMGSVPGDVPTGSTIDVYYTLTGEAKTLLGSTLLTSDRFALQTDPFSNPTHLTVTATDPDGNTSGIGVLDEAAAARAVTGWTLFASNRTGSSQIYSLDLISGLLRQVTDEHDNEEPALSQDASRGVYQSMRDGNLDLWTTTGDGTHVRITEHPGSDREAAWGPDSTLVFVSDRSGDYDLWVTSINLSEGTPYEATSLTSGTGNDRHPFWTSDGAWIYFESDRAGSPQIFRVSRDGSVVEQVTNGGGSQPSVSPDGTLLAYTVGEGSEADVFVLGLETETITRLTDRTGFDGTPAWTETGGNVLFATDRDGRLALYRVPSSGGAAVLLSHGFDDDFQPNTGPGPPPDGTGGGNEASRVGIGQHTNSGGRP